MIFYLIADDPAPSWGTGMLYEHVRLLRELGFDACVVHHQSPFRPNWRDLEVPVRYLDQPEFSATETDLVVVPEVLAGAAAPRRYPWRRVVFVQGSFLILRGMAGASDYRDLGYEAAMAVLPHVASVLERHFGLAAAMVPPFIASYFGAPAPAPRLPRVLLAVKDGYRHAGFADEEIAGALLAKELASRPGWSLLRLTEFTHRQVAQLMQTSTLLVNVNSLEAFNTTVPEAMATGCVPICYEAIGGRDFLRDGENAIVFPNHDVYALVERVCELIDDEATREPLFARLRAGGAQTAASFSAARTAAALVTFFSARGLAPTP